MLIALAYDPSSLLPIVSGLERIFLKKKKKNQGQRSGENSSEGSIRASNTTLTGSIKETLLAGGGGVDVSPYRK